MKCSGCASTLKKELKEEFGEVEVDLEQMPRQISLDISPDQLPRLKEKLRKLGYPAADENMSGFQNSAAKAKSFVSCAIGKFDNAKK